MTASASSAKIAYRPEVDGLRAVAIVAVVLGHAELGVPAGFVGVDVFFVISGYLITSLLRAEWVGTGRIDYFAFYARRIRRLFPALAVVVAITLCVLQFLPVSSAEISLTADSAAAAMLFLGNVFLQTHTGGYFDPSADYFPLLHLWSLGVEEQFYLLWPLALSLLLRARPQTQLALVAILGALSLALCTALQAYDPNVAFYQMPARFWELAAGGLVALAPQRAMRHVPWLAAAGLLGVLAATFVPLAYFPGFGALPSVACTAALLAAVHSNEQLGPAGALLRAAPAVFVGRISYSLYLWHWPLLIFARAMDAEAVTVTTRLALCAGAVVLAWLSYRFVEQPWRHRTGMPDRCLVFAGAGTSLVSAAACVALGSWLSGGPPDLAARTAQDMMSDRPECHYRADLPVGTFPPQRCIAPRNQPLAAAIWGDSHALAWRPFELLLAAQSSIATIPFTRDACPPALDYVNSIRSLEAQRCIEFNRRTVAWLESHTLDLLVLNAWWPDDARAAKFDPDFERTLLRVAPHAKRVLLIGPTPALPASVPHCIATGQLSACSVTRAQFDQRSRSVRAWLTQLAQRYPNVEYVEPEDFFCDAQQCPALRDGYGLYWDDHHVSATAARAFAQRFLQPAAAAPSLSENSSR